MAANLSSLETPVSPTLDELAAKYANVKADPNIAPFLRLLWDHDLIDCDTNPENSTPATRTKVQNLVYLAQHRFNLKFRYAHSMYLYGPYSVGLANDYFRMRDICDTPSGGPEGWEMQSEFLDFVKNHNDVRWLEIACTLIFAQDVDLVGRRGKLLGHVQWIKHDFQKGYITQVYDELVGVGFLQSDAWRP